MGQTSTKPNECTQSAHSSRASTPREFRESIVSEPQSVPVAPPRHQHQQKQQTQQEVPKITVVDCSFEQSPSQSPQTAEVFYDFESQPQCHGLNIEELNEAHEETLEDEVFDIPTTIYQQQANGIPRPWTRLTNVKLENVQEEAEEEDDPQAEPEPEDDELDEALDLECDDHGRGTPNGSRQSASSERSALKSDSNLSSSYADSGIGMGLGVAANESQPAERQQQQQQPVQTPTSRSAAALQPRHTPFVRDGNSTSTDCDCEELLLQCDELDDEQQFDERLVCIESISLPDVVVESTTVTAQANASSSSSSSSGGNNNNNSGNNGDGHLNINITNGAGGNSLGNVHFIPIHIEGSAAASAAAARSRSNSPKQRSLDDSCIGRNMPPSVEIVEDGSVLNNQTDSNRETLELK